MGSDLINLASVHPKLDDTLKLNPSQIYFELNFKFGYFAVWGFPLRVVVS